MASEPTDRFVRRGAMKLAAMTSRAFGGTRETIYVGTRVMFVVYAALAPMHIVLLSGTALQG